MSLEETQAVTPEIVTSTSDPVVENTETVEADTTVETVEETDEQKNAKVQQEAVAKAEKRARGVQKRMDELTADKYAERKRADDLAAQNARILALLEGQKAPAKSSDAPQREQFADDFSYVKAEAAYIARNEALELIKQAEAVRQQQQQQMSQAQAERQAAQAFVERQRALEKSIPDFRETLEDADISMPQESLAMIRHMEDGPLVAYHIAKNPDVALKLTGQPPYMQGIILGQISATLKSAPQISKAPPPGAPVKASSLGNASEPPSNPDLYAAWAAKHMR